MSLAAPVIARPATLVLAVEEPCGLPRHAEPITLGVPLPRGAVVDAERLTLQDAHGRPLPLQAQVLGRWPDRSLKWVLLDFQLTLQAREAAGLHLSWDRPLDSAPPGPAIRLASDLDAITVDTGAAVFRVDRHTLRPFAGIALGGVELVDPAASQVLLRDASGQSCLPEIRVLRVVAGGPLRATLRSEGVFRAPNGRALLEFIGEVSLYAGRGLAQVRLTLRNPRAARHPGGLWDLGDPGSVYFHDLSLAARLRLQNALRITWSLDPAEPLAGQPTRRLEIFQASSGGANWQSRNHVDRSGHMPLPFPGYRVVTDAGASQGVRATPTVAMSDGRVSLAGALPEFWQNFPKALEVGHGGLTARLFPEQALAPFELQGGEQKTHTCFLEVGPGAPPDLRWVHAPLLARLSPESWERAQALPYFTPATPKDGADAGELAGLAIGQTGFAARREIIDEYGWRHFGDLYADHEAVRQAGPVPLVAHYNNQYDPLYGCLLWYARSGDPRWWALADPLARHLIDIDLYHTGQDRPAFNGGLFWHTDHYTDAGTATHRAYSRQARDGRPSWQQGGGPSNEHNYTSGLLLYYYLTGNAAAAEAVRGLADWVLAMDDGGRTPYRFLDQRPTGLASATVDRRYHGPGRGAGNSINACLDAHALTGEPRYLAKAEELIRRCIHPADDIAGRQLSEVETRWSYTVFLQVLGKYLDEKAEHPDRMYAYATQSLLHYATWMCDHEVPYATLLDRVKIPTETWPAQDIRKANVFHFAAKHATGALRAAFQERAEFFFQVCLRDLRTFSTYALTRPLVLLLVNGPMHAYCVRHPEETAPAAPAADFGRPRPFVSQLAWLHELRDGLRAWCSVPGRLLGRATGGRAA